jgi:hypothetical protein
VALNSSASTAACGLALEKTQEKEKVETGSRTVGLRKDLTL